MLCSGLVCVSLSLVTTWLFTVVMPRKDAVEPVVSRQDRQELQKDVQAAMVLAAVGFVLYLSALWRRLFTAPATEPQPAQEPSDQKDGRDGEILLRRPSEHKETQCQIEEVLYTSVETQTGDCLLPVHWTLSDSQLSDASLTVTIRQLDTQMEDSSCLSPGTIQQPFSGGTSPDRVQPSTVQPLLKKNGYQDPSFQEASELLQVCKASQTSEELQDNLPFSNGALYVEVESSQLETSEKTTSQPATLPHSYATSSVKAEFPPSAGDLSPKSAQRLEASDLSVLEVDEGGLIMIREAAVHAAHGPQTLTVSLAADQSPRRSLPSPRSPTTKMGSYAARRRLTCNRCLNSRPPQASDQGNTEAKAGTDTAIVKVTASPTSPTARGGGDAPQSRLAIRQPAAGRGFRTSGKNQQTPCFSSPSFRPGTPCSRTLPTYVYKPPFA